MASELPFIEFIKNNSTATYRGFNAIETSDNGLEVYMSFQSLLRFISDNLNLFATQEPLLEIDWESNKPFYHLSSQISGNLSTLYIYNEYLELEDGVRSDRKPKDTNKVQFANFAPITFFQSEGGNADELNNLNATLKDEANIPLVAGSIDKYVFPQVGNLNFVYLNIGYLSRLMVILSNNPSSKLTLSSFLQTICDEINKLLGGINNIQVIIDDERILKIVDFNQKKIKNIHTILPPEAGTITRIKPQGLGTFVEDINVQSQITKDVATSIAIGAQAQGNQISEDAVTFSRLSKGLEDRIYNQKQITRPNSSFITSTTFLNNIFNSQLKAYTEIIKNQQPVNKNILGGKIIAKSTELSNNSSIIRDFNQAVIGKFTETNQSNPSFIPLKVSLTLYGISGIKPYQRFTFDNVFGDSEVLPLQYNNIDFIVLGISHKIEINRWVTQVSAISVFREEEKTPENVVNIPLAQVIQPPNEVQTTTGTVTILPGRYSTFIDNNPFNLRPNSGPQFNGFIGIKEGFRGANSIGYFAVFDTETNGVRAGLKNLEGYFTRRKLNNIKQIINTYAPPGSIGQTQQATTGYINNVVNYMSTNWKQGTTETTTLSFSGPNETDQNNIKMFKELNKAILRQEGKLTSRLIQLIDNFNIRNLA